MLTPTHAACPRRAFRRRFRSGSTLLFVAGALAFLAVVVGLAWFLLRGGRTPRSEEPLLREVILGPYEHVVTQQGEVESANNVEVRCEVRARSASGPSTSIIDIVPEGTWVKKGDWLITFDSSALEQDLRQQKIAVNTSEATMIQSKALYDTAVIARKEYLEGTYREQEKTILNGIFVAEEALKKAQLSYDSTKRLVSRGLLTQLQLEGEKFRVEAAANDLALAKSKLQVLEQFTRPKMLTQLDSDIQAAKVKYQNDADSYQEELNKLRDIEDQIAKCRVVAPQEGQVVYANVQSSRSGSEFVVEAGAMVRERQPVIRLPDTKEMQVKAKISESRINLVREGLPVTIRIDALGDEALRGEVTKVNKYAEPSNFWSSTSKQYATWIKIFNPPAHLRVGLSAEVRIHVERREQALQMPVQAVCERGGKTFCLVKNGDRWETREILISSTNDKMVALDEKGSEGLKPGDLVVMNPRRHLDKFDASRLPPATAEPAAGKVAIALAAGSAPGAMAGGQGKPPGVGKPGTGGGGASGPSPPGAASAKERPSPAQLFQQWDTDGDGKLAGSELDAAPPAIREQLTAADTNHDGALELSELGAALARLRAAGGRPPEDKPGGGA